MSFSCAVVLSVGIFGTADGLSVMHHQSNMTHYQSSMTHYQSNMTNQSTWGEGTNEKKRTIVDEVEKTFETRAAASDVFDAEVTTNQMGGHAPLHRVFSEEATELHAPLLGNPITHTDPRLLLKKVDWLLQVLQHLFCHRYVVFCFVLVSAAVWWMTSGRAPKKSNRHQQDDFAKARAVTAIAPVPHPTLACSILFATSLIMVWISAFVIQCLVAMLTSPLLCVAKEYFYQIQCNIYMTSQALLVAANPLWRVTLIAPFEAGHIEKKGRVMFCNHRSNADPWFAAWAQYYAGHLRQNMFARTLYKSSLLQVPFGGWGLAMTGHLPVHFGDPSKVGEMLNRARESLQNGYDIFVFPEGTRSPSGILQDFKPTFFRICAELGCAAVPLAILGSEQAWPHGSMKVGPARVAVVLGEPILPDDTGADGLQVKVTAQMRACSEKAIVAGEASADDPLVTDSPYSWWEIPDELRNLGKEERLRLLRSGGTHNRGKHLI